MRIAVEVVQHENGTGAGRQPGDRALEIQRLPIRSRSELGRMFCEIGIGPLEPANALAAAVGGDAAEPGPQTRLPAELVEPLGRTNPRVLQRILGIAVGPAYQTDDQPVHHRRMTPVQVAERLIAPRPEKVLDKLAIATHLT